jgi:hypothetical protein
LAVDDELILRLLRSGDGVERTLLFRTEVLDKPEAALSLLRVMYGSPPELAERARSLLCRFRQGALEPIGRALQWEGALWRYELLDVAWALVSVHPRRDRTTLLEQAQTGFRVVLGDPTVVQPRVTDRPEIEYVYRVCDQAYAVWRRLVDPGFDEQWFRFLPFDERDGEIRVLQARVGAPIV